MSDTTIRLSREAKARLELHKREGESYDDVIRRLTAQDKWAGFGALSDTDGDLQAAMQGIRDDMNEAMAEDIAAMGRDTESEDSDGGTERDSA